jgi:hypothetical protein
VRGVFALIGAALLVSLAACGSTSGPLATAPAPESPAAVASDLHGLASPSPTSQPTPTPTSSATAAPTPTLAPTPAPTQSLPPSPITVASVLKDLKAADKAFSVFPRPSIPSLKKYRPAPSVAALKKSFAALQQSPAWPYVDEELAQHSLLNCTSGKLGSPSQSVALFKLQSGCAFLAREAIVAAETTRDPAAIGFAEHVMAYVVGIALSHKNQEHGIELLLACKSLLQTEAP